MSNAHQAVENLTGAIGGFQTKLDPKIQSVDTSAQNIKASSVKIYDSIERFKNDMMEHEEQQIAYENILRIDQIIKERFGNYDTVRKTVMGVVRDFDINLVRNTSVQDLSEELWIGSSRYWLSYALIAISAWINDFPELAKNALAESVRKDGPKATLFFCLFNMRFSRVEAAHSWFMDFFRTVDPNELKPEAAIILQAFLAGAFGTDKAIEDEVIAVIDSWVVKLRANTELTLELTQMYADYIKLYPVNLKYEPEGIMVHCSESEEIVHTYLEISKLDSLLHLLDELNTEEIKQTPESYKSRIDTVLTNLITNFDEEEQELYDQQDRFQCVVDSGGKMDLAKERIKAMEDAKEGASDFGKAMLRWVIYDTNNQADDSVRKFAFSKTKEWFSSAVDIWYSEVQSKFPSEYHLSIDSWKGISNGEDSAEQIEAMTQYYETNKFSIMYINPPNIAALIGGIVCVGLAFAVIWMLVAAVACFGFLGWNAYRAHLDYPKRVEAALGKLKSTLDEITGFRQYYRDNRIKKDELLAKIEMF